MSTSPQSVSLRVPAVCGLLAPIAFVVGWAAVGLAQPDDYSLVHDQVATSVRSPLTTPGSTTGSRRT